MESEQENALFLDPLAAGLAGADAVAYVRKAASKPQEVQYAAAAWRSAQTRADCLDNLKHGASQNAWDRSPQTRRPTCARTPPNPSSCIKLPGAPPSHLTDVVCEYSLLVRRNMT